MKGIQGEVATSRQFSYIGALCSQIGLDREDRLELCRRLYGYGYENLQSVKDLTDDQVDDLIHVLRSFQLIERLQIATGAFETKAQTFLDYINQREREDEERTEHELLDEEG